jgi:hypothetical protein
MDAVVKEGYIVVDSKPAAVRWRWRHIKHWTIRASSPPADTISEPLYAAEPKAGAKP